MEGQSNLDRIHELLERLAALRSEARSIEYELKALHYDRPPILNEQALDQLVETLKKNESEERFFFSLTRIDFHDDYYTFDRAIDGDTIVVKPPDSLRDWMKDIHVRLYGLETPELWEERGDEYRKHLQNLCSDSTNGALMIVWERERTGTNYGGFPLSTFERGIGHVFIKASETEYYYINGLMNLLRYSSLLRKGRSLLRGKNRLNIIDVPFYGVCATELQKPKVDCSNTFNSIKAMQPPVCLLSYPKLPSLDPREQSFYERLTAALSVPQRRTCPFEKTLQANWSRLSTEIRAQNVSPFDLPLSFISMWAEERKRGAGII